jgi:hypothetical protein
VRRHGISHDAMLLATETFVSVVNSFRSMLNLFSRE